MTAPIAIASDLVSHRLWRTLFGVSLFFLSAFDFYFPALGLPIIPILGTLLMLTLAIMARPPWTSQLREVKLSLLVGILLIGTLLLSAAWGIATDGSVFIKAAAGIAMGVILYLALVLQAGCALFREWLFRCITAVLVIHFGAWVLQVIVFFVSGGTYLDYILPLTGVPTRHEYGAAAIYFVRFTGLFAEPAIYSTFMYLGIASRMVHNRYRLTRFDWLVIVSMLASLSLIGYMFALVLIAIMIVKRGHLWKGAAAAAGALAGGWLLMAEFGDSPVGQFLTMRLSSPANDPSGNQRFAAPFAFYFSLPEVSQLLGLGLGNYDPNFQPGNGVAYMLIYTGVIGSILFCLALGWLLWLRRAPWPVWVMIVATSAGAYLFTFQYWWLWIASLVILADREPLPALEPVQ